MLAAKKGKETGGNLSLTDLLVPIQCLLRQVVSLCPLEQVGLQLGEDRLELRERRLRRARHVVCEVEVNSSGERKEGS